MRDGPCSCGYKMPLTSPSSFVNSCFTSKLSGQSVDRLQFALAFAGMERGPRLQPCFFLTNIMIVRCLQYLNRPARDPERLFLSGIVSGTMIMGTFGFDASAYVCHGFRLLVMKRFEH